MKGSHAEDTEQFRNPEFQEFTSIDFDGPVKSRRCTDVCCLLLLLVAWGAMSFLGVTSFGLYNVDKLNEGDPALLFHGTILCSHFKGLRMS
jgi:hypothetical protein